MGEVVDRIEVSRELAWKAHKQWFDSVPSELQTTIKAFVAGADWAARTGVYIGWVTDDRTVIITPGVMIPMDKRKGEYIERVDK